MIPLHDANPTGRPPVMNRLLIAANVVAWLYTVSLQRSPAALGSFYDRYSFDWTTFVGAISHGDISLALFVPLFTHMFLHGGWLHVLGNMVYLWIFG